VGPAAWIQIGSLACWVGLGWFDLDLIWLWFVWFCWLDLARIDEDREPADNGEDRGVNTTTCSRMDGWMDGCMMPWHWNWQVESNNCLGNNPGGNLGTAQANPCCWLTPIGPQLASCQAPHIILWDAVSLLMDDLSASVLIECSMGEHWRAS